MIAFLSICYALLYILLFRKLKLIPTNNGTISAFVGVGVAMLGGIVFAWYTFAPISPDAKLFRYTIPIVANVRGLIDEVYVEPFKPMRTGEPLFRINPAPYEFRVKQVQASIRQFEAQRTLASLQVERARNLLKTQAAAQVDLDRWTAELEAAEAAIANAGAQLEQAQWELDETTVRAPTDGYAVNVALRPGVFVGTVGAGAVLPYISTDISQMVGSVSQSAVRHIRKGDAVEVTFPNRPGEVYPGRVAEIVQTSPSVQLAASGSLATFDAGAPPDRWLLRVALEDEALARSLPQGIAGTMAVYTQRGKPLHIISKVVMRINAWMAFLTTP